jgi:hypothetical protein
MKLFTKKENGCIEYRPIYDEPIYRELIDDYDKTDYLICKIALLAVIGGGVLFVLCAMGVIVLPF